MLLGNAGVCSSWDRNLIYQLLSYEEAQMICGIPLSYLGAQDSLIWHPARNGVFLVKSAYFLEMKRRSWIGGESSNLSSQEKLWKSVWRLQVPNLVKLFIWKACNDIIPTRHNLCKRKITDQALCPICERENETLIHALWSCPGARDVWGEYNSPLMKWTDDCRDMGELWDRITEALPKNSRELCALIFRNLWLRRNAVIFEDKFTIPKVLIHSAMQQLEGYQSATIYPLTAQASLNSNRTSRWLAPQGSLLKANWDAATSSNVSGFGGVLRDNKGEVILSFCSNHSSGLEPLVAEAMSLRKSMLICRELNLANIVFEGDCLQVVSAVSNPVPRNDVLAPILFDIHRMLEGALGWTVAHTPRQTNRAAHGLAKLACNLSDDVIWMEESPEIILDVLLEDKLCINLFDE